MLIAGAGWRDIPYTMELVSRLALLVAPLLNAEVGLQRSGMRGQGLPKWNNSRRLSYREDDRRRNSE
jgi:hypothetical protein